MVVSRVRKSSTVLTGTVPHTSTSGASVLGVPSQFIFRGSKRAGLPVTSGTNGGVLPTSAITLPSLSATL